MPLSISVQIVYTSRMPTFTRDRFTWLAYCLLAYFAYLQAAPGPLMPFIRSELNLSYTAGALHLSAFALGMIGGGLSAPHLAARWGRRAVLWWGAAGIGLGALLFVAGRHPAVTIASTLLMGGAGTLLLVMIQATLSDRHGAQRATALTESNILAILCAGMLPLLVGLFEGTILGWRGAIYLGIAAALLLALAHWRTPIPLRRPRQPHEGSGRLPAIFWAYWTILLLSVAMEWSLIGWSADFLNTVVGVSLTNATMLVSVFFLGAVLGRIANSRWTRSLSLRRLLLAMLLVVAAGFPLLWLARWPVLNVLGLAVVGFGVGSLFPLGVSLALTVAADEADAASGYTSLGTGLAMLAAPFTLGWLADTYGLASAYGAVSILIGTAIVVTLLANRADRTLP